MSVASEFPSSGARFQLDRISGGQSSARYGVTIHVPDGVYSGTVELSVNDGAPKISIVEREPADLGDLPEWIEVHVRALARQLTRGAKRNGTWSRRLRRWKGE